MPDKNQNISFLLGDEKVTISLAGADGLKFANMTVLEYLRDKLGLKGTKEGCAEGDCGACTVVLVEEKNGKLTHSAVNSCIQLLPTLHGKQVLTIEHVANSKTPHPALESMVAGDTSQCGFCTPGFTMSLVALYENGGAGDDHNINDALAGNLCRCTGYGPIIEAAKKMGGQGKPASNNLKTLKNKDLSIVSDHYFAPTSINELAEIYSDYPHATLLAGGTDVGLWLTKQQRTLDCIIYLGNVYKLKTISEGKTQLTIGAGVTYSEVHDIIAGHYPHFGEIIRRTGAKQVRNVGTIGGNIANGSPIGDSPPVLIALGGSIVLRKGEKTREIPLEDFYISYGKQDLGEGEFLEAINIPLGANLKAYKVSKRFDQDISAVLGAFNIMVNDGVVTSARVAYGGMAGTPARAKNCEKALIGKQWNRESVERAAKALEHDFSPLSDMRASKNYRMDIAKNLLIKCYMEDEGKVATNLLHMEASP